MLSRGLHRFYLQLDKLSNVFQRFDGALQITIVELLCLEKAVIQLQIEWENFVRNLILDSATGRYSNSSGTIVTSHICRPGISREAACSMLMSTFKKRTYEPDWYLPKDAIDAADRLSLSNFSNISLHLGVTPWEIEDLRHFRNFLAHRSKRSAENLRAVLTTYNGQFYAPKIIYGYTSSGDKVYERWISFMKLTSKNLIA